MNEQTSQNQDQNQPTEKISEQTPAPASEPAAAPADAKRRGIARPLLIGIGSAVAVLLIAGAGAAIALSIADGDDDRDDAGGYSQTGETGTQSDDTGNRNDDQSDSGTDSDSGAGQSDQGAVSADATALTDAIDAALAAVPGATGATAIEVERNGWDVDVALEDGTETEVHVATDGTTTIREDDFDEDADPVLDTARISAIIDAAIAEAGGGTIESIQTDDDRDHYYEVTVDLGDGRDTEIEFTEDLTVVSVDTDD